jgi:hypothetical protein
MLFRPAPSRRHHFPKSWNPSKPSDAVNPLENGRIAEPVQEIGSINVEIAPR